jgi:cysteine-rich repeat protein
MRFWKMMVGCLFAVGCTGTPGSTVTLDQNGDNQSRADLLVDLESPKELVSPPDLLPADDILDLVFDVPVEDSLGPQCSPGEGCFLDPCTGNEDCLSGWCVGHMGENVCTVQCQSECAPGWSCQQIPGTAPDVVFVCISDHANLCLPCAAAADCKGAAGADNVCVDYGAEGSFCGGKCVVDDDCPWGFSCADTTTVDGIATKQCVADTGVCPCTKKSVELSLWTACEVTNQFGSCLGQRVCGTDGLSACDALAPQEEICNGLDDDCDGAIDEPGLVEGKLQELCDDGNSCTEDACKGDLGCQQTPLTGTECFDGNSCTVADHCDAGECVGSPVDCDDDNPCTDDFCNEAGGCLFQDNAADCDDGDPCTVADECSGGQCSGTTIACDCHENADCAPLEDGNLCNGTLVCNTTKVPYQCEVSPDTVVTCPEAEGADAACLAASCDPVTGACSLVAANGGKACEDTNPCTIGDTCQNGLCTGGVALNCADDNVCTDDSCDPESGCVHAANSAGCQDGDACTIGDGCVDGTCVAGDPLVCDDGNECTADSCSPAWGCLHEAVAGQCDDGNACTLGDHCSDAKCLPSGLLSCDDENPCTNDSCNPQTGCFHLLNQAPCDDGDVCTTGDHCSLGDCIGSGELTCNDNNPCTQDTCNSTNGCTFLPEDGGPCSDNNACTEGDLCSSGQCLPGDFIACDDGNLCTTDSCAPATGCVYEANAVACDDGELCTVDDHCDGGICVGGMLLNCDDENPCTDDSCDGVAGCLNINNTLGCDDGNACTGNDVCAGGECHGVALDCDDQDLCTDDSCDPDVGCQYQHNVAPCDDNNECTTGDVCAAGQCLPGGATDCNDSVACTDDTCDPEQGCLHTPVAPCCSNGVVEAGEQCDDSNLTNGDGCDDSCQNEAAAQCYQPYSNLSENWRNVSYGNGSQCDSGLSGWYRFTGAAGTKMPDSAPPVDHCNTDATGWLQGGHPTVQQGVVTRKACFNWVGQSCWSSNNIKVVNCGGFYLYQLGAPGCCSCVYCGTN